MATLSLPSSAQRVVDAAASLDLTIEVQEFPDGTRTAADAAAAVGCDVAQIVKSLVFVAGDRPVLALVSGPNRLDEATLAASAGGAGAAGVGRRGAGGDVLRRRRGAALRARRAAGRPGSTATC